MSTVLPYFQMGAKKAKIHTLVLWSISKESDKRCSKSKLNLKPVFVGNFFPQCWQLTFWNKQETKDYRKQWYSNETFRQWQWCLIKEEINRNIEDSIWAKNYMQRTPNGSDS